MSLEYSVYIMYIVEWEVEERMDLSLLVSITF